MKFLGIIYSVAIAELCKGSTTDSDSVCLGSNPSSAAKKPAQMSWFFIFYILKTQVYIDLGFCYLLFCKIYAQISFILSSEPFK